MAVDVGVAVEQAIITAAGIEALNIDPGSMRIDLVNEPVTTVRFTLVVDVPGQVVKDAIRAAMEVVPGA